MSSRPPSAPSIPSPTHGSSTPRNTMSQLPPSSPSTPPFSRRLAVHEAATGRFFDLQCSTSDTVASLKESLVRVMNINVMDQIWIAEEGSELDSRFTIAHYSNQLSAATPSPTAGTTSSGSGSQSNEASIIFVFNRPQFSTDPNFRLPPLPQLPSFDPLFPSDRDVLDTCPPRDRLKNGPLVLARNLPAYELQFSRHILEADAISRACDNMKAFASNAVAQQRAILAAVEAAMKNLQGHVSHMTRKCDSFTTSFQTAVKENSALFESWNRDLEKLKEVEIPQKMKKYVGAVQQSPAMDGMSNNGLISPLALPSSALASPSAAATSTLPSSTSSRITLYDCLAPALMTLNKTFEESSKAQAMLKTKVESLSSKQTTVDGTVTQLLTNASHRTTALQPLQQVAELIHVPPTSPHSEQSLLPLRERLNREYSQVHNLINQLEQALESGSNDFPNVDATMIDSFERINLEHIQSLLPRFHVTFKYFKERVLGELAASAVAVQALFFDQLSKISTVSPAIRNVVHLTRGAQVAFDHLLALSRPLHSIHHLPTAWSATLLEISRRKGFRRSFQQEVQAMSNRIHRLTMDELNRREKFHKEHAVYLPKGHAVSAAPGKPSWSGGFGPLVAHLSERPPMLDLSFADFDSNLPDLDGGSGPSLPRSGSSHSLIPSLPPIEESRGETNSNSTSPEAIGISTITQSSSSSLSLLSAAHLSSSTSSLLSQFPWISQLESKSKELAAAESANASLTKQLAEMKEKLAALSSSTSSLSPRSQHVRKSSLTSSSPSAAAPSSSTSVSAAASAIATSIVPNTNSPTLTSRRSSTKDTLTSNNAQLELKLSSIQSELDTKTEQLEKSLTQLKRVEEELKAEKNENTSMSLNSARLLKEMSQLRKEKDDLSSEKNNLIKEKAEAKNELEIWTQSTAKKLALQNFAAGDLVLLVRKPAPAAASASSSSAAASSSDSGAQFEVFNRGSPNYFLNPDCWRQLLRMRQERADALIAQAAASRGRAGGDAAAAEAAEMEASKIVKGQSRPFGEMIGEIIELDRYVAEAARNPFQLPIGTVYHEVTIICEEEAEQPPAPQEEKSD